MESGFFLCGCEILPPETCEMCNGIPPFKWPEYEGKPLGDIPQCQGCGNTGFKPVKKDEEGYLICPVHGERRYGWRSKLKVGPQGNMVPDWHNMGTQTGKLDLKTDFPDKRIKTNAEEIGLAIFAERAKMGARHYEDNGKQFLASEVADKILEGKI